MLTVRGRARRRYKTMFHRTIAASTRPAAADDAAASRRSASPDARASAISPRSGPQRSMPAASVIPRCSATSLRTQHHHSHRLRLSHGGISGRWPNVGLQKTRQALSIAVSAYPYRVCRIVRYTHTGCPLDAGRAVHANPSQQPTGRPHGRTPMGPSRWHAVTRSTGVRSYVPST